LESIVEANTASLSRLRSCAATLEVTATVNMEDKGMISSNDLYSVWADGRKVREDFTALNTGPERRIEIGAKGGEEHIYYGRPAARKRVISPESVLSYRPGSDAMSISPGNAKSPYGRGGSVLFEYAGVLGHTLEEKVRQNAAEGYLPVISEVSLDGVDCRLMKWEYPDVQMAMKIWVVPSKGCMVKRLETYHKGNLGSEWQANVDSYGDGVFWFSKVDSRQYVRGAVREHQEVNVKELHPNVPVDASVFTIQAMDIPPGTEVQDRIIGLKHRYGDPFSLPEAYIESAIESMGAAKPEGNCTDSAESSPRGDATPKVPPSAQEQAPLLAGLLSRSSLRALAVLLLILGALAALGVFVRVVVRRRSREVARGQGH
jgi:hypothetical protein